MPPSRTPRSCCRAAILPAHSASLLAAALSHAASLPAAALSRAASLLCCASLLAIALLRTALSRDASLPCAALPRAASLLHEEADPASAAAAVPTPGKVTAQRGKVCVDGGGLCCTWSPHSAVRQATPPPASPTTSTSSRACLPRCSSPRTPCRCSTPTPSEMHLRRESVYFYIASLLKGKLPYPMQGLLEEEKERHSSH
ncbi:hypothetical protein PR202_gb16304 [Eleusine coracana subsp. coracana]|uniref:Uncharacterized protein n=1 Tax=Eleusine coracana subsp. coracana TaxID=191504 RepID=A0AAV5F0Q1_ELECO|nr:hypothetical protein PR202_gb16304 [Eleusine coracana subsp. coracana]